MRIANFYDPYRTGIYKDRTGNLYGRQGARPSLCHGQCRKLGIVGNNFSLGIDYKGINANLTANAWQQKVGLGLHYGAQLLPFQDQMANTFNAGANSLGNLVTGLPGAFYDPIAFYQQNKTEVGNVTKTADLIKQITAAVKNRIRFGGDFSITYDPTSILVIAAKVGLMF